MDTYHKNSKIEDYAGEPLKGATIICDCTNKQIVTIYCKQCNCYLCFECQMGHFDHAKDNFEDASEETLIEKISSCMKDILSRLDVTHQLYS